MKNKEYYSGIGIMGYLDCEKKKSKVECFFCFNGAVVF